MERKVGEIFEYNGEWYQCIHTKSLGCENCDLATKSNIHCSDVFEIRGECLSCYRKDGKSVIFKKLEKVGEPIRIENKSYQKIKVSDALCNNCAFYDNFSRDCKLNGHINHYPTYSCLINEMFVEIKQNKENMGEKKLNLKPFDLEAAKAGKPVCTRDGRKARIICFDYKGDYNAYPILALISTINSRGVPSEIIAKYTEDGRYVKYNNVEYNEDLMMLPQKKEGWVNVYNSLGVITFSHNPYDTKEEAMKDKGKYYVDTVKIEW